MDEKGNTERYLFNFEEYLDENNIQKTPEGQVLDKLHLTKMCCRRHMLTHVDIE